jgi:hypothetical protein
MGIIVATRSNENHLVTLPLSPLEAASRNGEQRGRASQVPKL